MKCASISLTLSNAQVYTPFLVSIITDLNMVDLTDIDLKPPFK